MEQEACVQHTQGRESLLALGGYPQNTENALEIISRFQVHWAVSLSFFLS